MIIKIRRLLLLSIFCISLSSLTGLKTNVGEVTGVLDLDIVFIGNRITYGVRLENPQFEAPTVVASINLRYQKESEELIL